LKTHAIKIATTQSSPRAPSKKFPIQTPNGLRLLRWLALNTKIHFVRKKKPDSEIQQFQADLLQSVRDMKSGRAGRVHRVPSASSFPNVTAQNLERKKQNEMRSK
jgi:hypothetical protein